MLMDLIEHNKATYSFYRYDMTGFNRLLQLLQKSNVPRVAKKQRGFSNITVAFIFIYFSQDFDGIYNLNIRE